MNEVRVRCCIAGGGPAGMMLALLLGRAGVPVLVLEKHADFLRDFRGDTVHPSTLEVLYELGLIDAFLARPHQQVRDVVGRIGVDEVPIADFTHLPTHCQFLVLMPQWHFLNFLREQLASYPHCRLLMRAEVTDVLVEQERVAGVRVATTDGTLDVRSDVIVGADGRGSIVRARAGLVVDDLGAPIDVLWMRLSRRPSDPDRILGNINAGHVFVMLNRDDYWQCAFVIPKGGLAALQEEGLPAFRDAIADTVPFMRDRVDELRDWSEIKLLTVKIDRLREWARPGLLCIGDAAHAMSPIGGVGINLAIQDAVAAANLLALPLREGAPSIEQLRQVQRRRELPTRITQRMQVLAQDRLLRPVLGAPTPDVPLAARLLQRLPVLRRIPARLVGLGVRPEHVRSPALPPVTS